MFDLKRLSRDGVEAALTKAEHYRMLNEPWEAESICHDVLAVEREHQHALVVLLLALTDQFDGSGGDERLAAARAALPRLSSEYARAYYEGIICERWAKRLLETDVPGTGPAVYHWLRQAMARYDEAERLRPPGDDDAILRWNTCVRLIERHPHARPAPEGERAEIPLE